MNNVWGGHGRDVQRARGFYILIFPDGFGLTQHGESRYHLLAAVAFPLVIRCATRNGISIRVLGGSEVSGYVRTLGNLISSSKSQ